MGTKHLYAGITALSLLAASNANAEKGHWDNDTQFTVAELTGNSATAPNGDALFEIGAGLAHLGKRYEGGLQWMTSSAPLVTGTRTSHSIIPRFGAHLSWGDKDGAIQPFAAAGLPIQFRSGAAIERRMGFAVSAETGVRAVGCSKRRLPGFCMGMSGAMRYQLNMSEYQLGEAVLPGGSSTLSFPISFFAGVRR